MSKDNPPKIDKGKPPVALIAGPTASGKSDLTVRLALRLKEAGRRAVVINADSAQVYGDLAILSARPSLAEMQGIDHKLFGAWDGMSACSAADWAEAARREIADIHATGGIPILVGGTGLYVRTLIDGIAPIPPIDLDIRFDVRAMPVAQAYAALEREDPERAALLNPQDSSRVARALEVIRSTGKPLAFWQRQPLSGGIGTAIDLYPLILQPAREWLYERCDTRFELMLDAGAVEEVEALLVRKLDPSLPVMRAIGVPEIAGWLTGAWDKAEAIRRGQQSTRNYAKRQYTWFRRQPPEHWLRADGKNISLNSYFESLLRN